MRHIAKIAGLNEVVVICRNDPFAVLLALVWMRTVVVSYCFSVVELLPAVGTIAGALEILLYATAVVFALPVILKKLKSRDLLLILVVVALYALNIAIVPTTEDYLRDNAPYILLINFSALFVGLMIDKNKYIRLMYQCSKLCIIAVILFFLLFGFSPESTRANEENMGLAYRILPHVCMIMVYAISEKKPIDLFFTVAGMLLVLACGVRGAALCCVGCFVAMLLISTTLKQKIWILLLGIPAIVIIFVGYYDAISALASIFQSFGFSTRVLDSLLAGTTFVDDPRSLTTDWVLQAINERPYTGYGIAGDRNLVPTVVYSHALWLEMWASYGYIVGSIFLLALVVLYLRAFLRADALQRSFILSMMFGGGLVKLFVSSSYLLEFQFFMLIGYCLCLLRDTVDDCETRYLK